MTYFLVFCSLSPLFHEVGTGIREGGRNLLSGQGLKGFVCFIPELEESGGLIAKLTGPWAQLPRPEHHGDGVLTFVAIWTRISLVFRNQSGGR